MPRLEWSPDGTQLLTCVDGTLRTHTLEGVPTIVDGPDVLDARWRGDRCIVAIDRTNTLREYRGREVAELPREYQLVLGEAWLAASDCYLATAGVALFVATFDGKERWRLDTWKHNLSEMERTSAAVSADGKLVAIGTETRGAANFAWQRREGRGWVVIDTSANALLDRSWTATKRERTPMQLAFDAAGRRLAMATPEPGPCVGVLRVGKDEKYAREHTGGARAVALDDKGIVAAYAYPETIDVAPRRLRVDYLEPGVKPASKIAILDTLWIDPAVSDIVALAFDRASRRIACAGASGRIDIVPVP